MYKLCFYVMLDKIDQKILLLLIKNSRSSITSIAKKARISRDVTNYRINRMVKKRIIRNFITEIDIEKLGYTSALLFVSIKADIEKEFIQYINKLDFVSWAGTHLGFWSLGMAVYGKNNNEVEKRLQLILKKYKDHITNHQFAFYKNTKFFTEKYFGHFIKPTSSIKSEKDYKIDNYDKLILKKLSKNARISSVELSKLLPITAPAISQRISRLKKYGYILKYSAYINVFKMGIYQFIFFITNRNLDERIKLYSFLEYHPKVPLLLDYIGDPFIEFGIFAENPYEIRKILQEIKELFPDNKIVDFFLTQEDFISYGAPECVFQ